MSRYYLDTEFNGPNGGIISLALVSEDEENLYLSAACPNPVKWVVKNVMPVINCAGAKATQARPEQMGYIIANFLCRDAAPIIVADWPDDISYFCKALIIAPGKMVNIDNLTFEMHRVDAYPTNLPGAIQHNALWDARALRYYFLKHA